MNKFWLGVLCGAVGLVIGGLILPKHCEAEYGATIYSSYYSSAHVGGVFGDYYDDYDFEFGGYITGNDATLRSGVTSYLVQGNLKTELSRRVFFLYGLSVEFFSNGEAKGVAYSGTSYGPFIGIERVIDENLRIRAIYHPVYISSVDVGGTKTTTTDFGLNGAFGLTYLF